MELTSSKFLMLLQMTVGGYGPNGKDACNDVTMMCLKASRRLPLNAPCLSLRLTPHTPQKYKQEAAKAILSGGAHPILFCDDKMVQGGQLIQHGHTCALGYGFVMCVCIRCLALNFKQSALIV